MRNHTFAILFLLLTTRTWGQTYTITIDATNGSVWKDPDAASYASGTEVFLIPRPAVGYCFDEWTGDVANHNLVGRVIVNGNKSVTAHFKAWAPPIGIPAPAFGITQTYRMYDDAGVRAASTSANGVTYTQNAEGGYYTAYVDNTDPTAEDSDDTGSPHYWGTAAHPRLTMREWTYYPAGSVVEIHGGPYSFGSYDNGKYVPWFSANGTATYPVFIRGATGTTPELYNTNPRIRGTYMIIENLDLNKGGFLCNYQGTGDHIVFRGNEIRNADPVGVYGRILIAGGWSNIVAYRNYVHHNGDRDYYLENDAEGVTVTCDARYDGLSYPTDVWAVDNHFAYGGGVGFMVNSSGFTIPYLARRVYVGRNVCHSSAEAGIAIKAAADTIVSQNTVFDYRPTHFVSSGSDGTCIVLEEDGPHEYIWIMFNTVFHGYQGIRWMDPGNIFCNVVYDMHNEESSTGAGILGWATPIGEGALVNVCNNTVYNADRGFVYNYIGDVVINITNNIFANRHSGSTQALVSMTNTQTSTPATFNNNLVYDPSVTATILWGQTTLKETMAEFQTRTGKGAGCIATAPDFVSADNHDFHLNAASPAVNTGMTSGAMATMLALFSSRYGIDIRKDVEGKARTEAWDIGAYEYLLAPVTSLSVSGSSQNSLTLTWTVPGEQRVTGTPAGYDIRYGDSSLTEANWDAATQVQGEPVAGNVGQQQSFTVAGLAPGSTYYVAIKVLDEIGHTSTLSNVISATTATSGNHAPVFTPIGGKSVTETETLTFSISAMDADGDPLTYSATSLPMGASFTAATQTFTWTPTNLQSGRYRVTFQVSDAQVTVSETVTITVRAGIDQPPVLAAVGDKTTNENTSLSFPLSATDPDGDPLTFSAAGLPSGANFAGGVFSWIPGYEQAGSYSVTFTVSDGELTDSEQITITVANVSDQIAPSADQVFPAPDTFQAPVNPVITLALSDAGLGVDASTVAIRVGDQLVYTGNSILYNSLDGICRRTGNPMNYRYYFFPNEPYDFDQPVPVLVNASDLAHNVMTPLSYQFVTQMRSFGQNELVSSNAGNSGHPAIATDSHGNIWAAWHAGAAGAGDIHVAKRGADAQQWAAPLRLTNQDSDQRNPVIAIGSNDTLYVAWQGNRRGNWDIYVDISLDGTTWQDPIRVTDPNTNETNPAIAIDHASPNHVYIAWQQEDAVGNQDICVASSSTGFASKSVSQVTSHAASQTEPALAVGSDNTVYLVWTDQRNVSGDIYGSSSASSWNNVPIVTDSGDQHSPAIAVEPGTSTLHMLWASDGGSNSDVLCGVSNGLPAAPISGSSVVDDTSADPSAPAILAVKDHWNRNHIYACWQDNRNMADAGDSDLYFAEIRSNMAGTNVLVADDGANSSQSTPALGFDRYGEPVVLWVDDRNGTAQIYSACSTYPDPGALASATIPSLTGGRVGPDPTSIRNDSDVSITIASNALGCDAPLAISEILNVRKFRALCLAGYEISPSGIQFSPPATVVIPYTASGSGPGIPYWYDAQTGMLSQLGITDITHATLPNGLSVVSFKTTHLTPFYVLAGPSGGGGGVGGGGGCALSRAPEESIVACFLPYAALVLFLLVRRWMDRRHKRDSE